MESNIVTHEINPHTAAQVTSENGDRRWHVPVLSIFEMSGANGDPTISDDGLGDGLFGS
ncbi:MAG: hypothetical protein ABJC09_02660 [Terriglobia bacterium]